MSVDLHATPAAAFLRERGADRMPHPGGTLYQHVVRVAGLLAEWGADAALRTAGLCHACYGTDGFASALLRPDERPVLVDLIGEPAEALVYLYGSCDRAAVYPRLGGAGPVPFLDRFTGRTAAPSEREIRAFTELTAANELDVLRHNAALAKRHGPALLWLLASARPRLSESAWLAWSRHPELQAGAVADHLDGDQSAGEGPSALEITGLDHLVLTVADVDQAVAFYERVLGMRPVTFGAGRRAVTFGPSKINFHEAGREVVPHAARPVPGSADLCLVTRATPERVLAHLETERVTVAEGPVQRTGARGPITSVYIRDPDENLIEIAFYGAVPPAEPAPAAEPAASGEPAPAAEPGESAQSPDPAISPPVHDRGNPSAHSAENLP